MYAVANVSEHCFTAVHASTSKFEPTYRGICGIREDKGLWFIILQTASV